jgi:diacylglycerol kinase (ATP)
MHVLLVVNPAAGSGRAARLAPGIARALEKAGRDVELIVTTSSGDLRRIVSETSAEQVLAVGGDGTAHDAALGVIAGGCEAALGVIPAGSGNDFSRALGMPRDALEAVPALIHAPIACIDYGSVSWTAPSGDGTSVFVNAIGCGFDAAVAARARRIPHLRGIPRYLLAVLGELMHWKSPGVTIESEEIEWEGRALLVTLGNGISSGGGFLLTPRADLRDGLLDLCVAHHMSIQRILRVIPAVLRAKHLGLPDISFATVGQVRITFDRGVPVHLDGEIASLDATSIRVQVIPKRLKVLIPRLLGEDEKETVKKN